MSRSKISQQGTSKHPLSVARSPSVSRRETNKTKSIGEDDNRGLHKTERNSMSKRKPQETSSKVPKETTGQATSSRKVEPTTTKKGSEVNATQSKPLTSKQTSGNYAVKGKSTSQKTHSSLYGGSGSQLKEQSKSVNPNKQGISRSNVKGNEVLKASSFTSDPKKGIIPRQTANQDAKSSRSIKKYDIQSQSEKTGRKKVDQHGTELSDIGSGDGKRLSRERTKTRTLNPGDSQLMTTLQHAAQQLPQEIETQSSGGAENEYEDDFEDYESDFEEAPSLENTSEEESDDLSNLIVDKNDDDDDDDDDKENYDYGDSSSSLSDLQINKDVHQSINGKMGAEEKKMDSGHYDLAEEHRLNGKTSGLILGSKKILEKETATFHDLRFPQGEEKSSSENYEIKFVNFASAKKRQQERKASSKMKQRGEILLNMIRLDSVTVPLFDKAPVPYEIYMRSYGRSNTQQVSSQTNEDGVSEEVQTNEIVLKNKWTQHPPAFVHPDDSIPHPLICAVSSDPCDAEDLLMWKQGSKVNKTVLEKFVLNAGQLMLNILEEMSCGTQGLLKANKVDLGFSQGFITLTTESVPFLKDRRVSKICFVPHQPNNLLSVHLSHKERNWNDDLPAQMVQRCLLCLWNLLQPSQPVKILVSSSDVTACIFHPDRPYLLFAGLVDGILNVWDLKEQSPFTNGVLFEGVEWSLKSPSYATVDQLGKRHSSAIVGVQVIDSLADSPSKGAELSPTQVCSLDESGLCLLWTVLRVSSMAAQGEDGGIAPWGCIRLLQNESFSIAHHVHPVTSEDIVNVQFSDLALDGRDAGHMLAATNAGLVAHCLSSGGRSHPPVYRPDSDCLSPATCICPCPFGLPYFLVGCGDGTIRLHTQLSTRPLLSVAGSGGVFGSGSPIARIQWSTSRPCVFFVLDADSRLHVWDLGSSDMYPMLSVPFRGKTITTMTLSPSRHAAKAYPYLALGTSCGKLKVHLVKDELASTSLEDTAVELDKFKRYVTIL